MATALFGTNTWIDYQTTLQDGWAIAETTTSLLEDQISRALEASQLVAAQVVELAQFHGVDYFRGPGWSVLRTLDDLAPQIGAIVVADEDGNLIASSAGRNSPMVNIADREFYIAVRAGQSPYISPMLLDRVIQDWFFGYNQGILIDGQFRGLVQTGMYANYFRRFYENLGLGPEARIIIYRGDGAVVMRWPLPESDRDENTVETSLFREHLPQQPVGHFETTGTDGTPLLTTYRTLPDMGLVITTTISRDHALAPFWERLYRNTVVFALAALLTGILVTAAIKAARRERETRLQIQGQSMVLDRQARELEAILDAVPAALFIAQDRQAQTIRGNRTACDMLRLPLGSNLAKTAPDRERPMHFQTVVNGVELPDDELPVQRAARDGIDIRDFEFDLIFNDGDSIHLFGNAMPLRDDQGNPAGAVGAFVDITDRRRTEAAVNRANAAKTRFLAAASHDLRQPMQALILFQGLLAIQNRDPKLKPVIEKVGKSLDVQQQMLNTLLDISRLDAGIVEIEKTHFPIAPLLEGVVNELHMEAAAKGLKLCAIRSTAIVESDPRQLERILRNLLTNAIKYTDRGGILLGCRRAGASVKLQVWDTGQGIPPDQITSIFEEFVQLDNPERDRSKGLGLGLSIVDRLARLLGHRIAVRSRVGKGTVFEIEIPLASRLSPPQVSGERGLGFHAPSSTGCIVVIDDDRDVLEAIRLSLEAMGYRVVAGPSLEAILPRVREQERSPDVVVADYRLTAGRTGTEAIRHLQSEFGKPLLSVLLTGDTSPARLQETKRSGYLLLHKPIKFDELAAAIGQALSRRS